MTDKKSTTTKRGGKGARSATPEDKSRGGLYGSRGEDHNPLTRETSIELLEKLLGTLYEHAEPEPCDDFLLLLYALAHEPDARERWIIYADARRVFTGSVSGADDTIDTALAKALGRLKGDAQR
jgi:hypothetical protein